MAVFPNNILQQVQTYQRSSLGLLLNLCCHISTANTKFKDFDKIQANLGSSVTFDTPPRATTSAGLVVSWQPAVQCTPPLHSRMVVSPGTANTRSKALSHARGRCCRCHARRRCSWHCPSLPQSAVKVGGLRDEWQTAAVGSCEPLATGGCLMLAAGYLLRLGTVGRWQPLAEHRHAPGLARRATTSASGARCRRPLAWW